MNVNTADPATLETLPGVGATTVQRIIDGRPYSSLADLEKVKGLSKTKVEAAKDQITFGSTSAAKTKTTKSTSGKRPPPHRRRKPHRARHRYKIKDNITVR